MPSEHGAPSHHEGLADDLRAMVDQARTAPATKDTARRAIALLDFTSLNDDDDEARITAFCRRAVTPAGTVAGVCVYPRFVPLVRQALAGTEARTVTVTNFPTPGTDPDRAAAETRDAVAAGAEEVDIVFPYPALLAGDARAGAAIVAACRAACGLAVTLKVILETSLLPSAALVAEASRIAIGEGADFIKTSTGKAGGGATLEAAAVMLDVIRGAGRTVGLKPSGGVRTAADAAGFMALGDAVMGEAFVRPATFRIGASGVMTDLLRTLGLDAAPTAPSSGY